MELAVLVDNEDDVWANTDNRSNPRQLQIAMQMLTVGKR